VREPAKPRDVNPWGHPSEEQGGRRKGDTPGKAKSDCIREKPKKEKIRKKLRKKHPQYRKPIIIPHPGGGGGGKEGGSGAVFLFSGRKRKKGRPESHPNQAEKAKERWEDGVGGAKNGQRGTPVFLHLKKRGGQGKLAGGGKKTHPFEATGEKKKRYAWYG